MQISLLQKESLFEQLTQIIPPIASDSENLVFVINSIFRERILLGEATTELGLIKQHLGEKAKIFGIFSDYVLCKNETSTSMSKNGILLTQWK